VDNNNPAAQTAQPNIAPAQPVMPQTPIPAESSNGSNKVIIWFIIGLVVVILLVGGIYFYLSRQQVTPSQTQTTTTQATPSPSPQDNLEGDLNSINIPSGADDVFTTVDQDLQQL